MKSNRFVLFLGILAFRFPSSSMFNVYAKRANEFSVDKVAESIEDVFAAVREATLHSPKMENFTLKFRWSSCQRAAQISTKRISNYCLPRRHLNDGPATVRMLPKNTNSILAWKILKVCLIVAVRPMAMNIFVHEII